MTIAAPCTLLAFVSLIAGDLLFRASSGCAWHHRLRAFLTPPLLVLCLAEIAAKILASDRYIWNEIRLARTFGLYNGVPLYPARDATGPILGTLHTPLSHILYWPATFASSPVAAVRAGVSMSVLLLLAALLLAHLSASSLQAARHPERQAALHRALPIVFAMELCWLGAMNTTIMSCVFVAHADPIGIACTVCAGGLLLRRPTRARTLVISALFAVLAITAKQTFAPLPFALLVFVYLVEGRRIAIRYALYLTGWTILAAASMAVLFHPVKNLRFNLITLAAHRPPQPVVSILPHLHDPPGITANRLYHLVGHALHRGSEGHAFASFLLLFLVGSYLLVRRQEQAERRSFRGFLQTNRWLVFAVIALGLFPLLFKASITLGGDQNHLAIADFFLLLALTTGYLLAPTSTIRNRAAHLRHLLPFCLILLFSFRSIHQIKRSLAPQPTLTAQAAAFSREHPGLAYLPSNPLTSFYATRRFYTFDHSIEDREIAGYPPTPEQFASGLPQDVTLIAIDPRTIAVGELSNALHGYLNSGWTRVSDPDLPLFVVFRRSAAPPNLPSPEWPAAQPPK